MIRPQDGIWIIKFGKVQAGSTFTGSWFNHLNFLRKFGTVKQIYGIPVFFFDLLKTIGTGSHLFHLKALCPASYAGGYTSCLYIGKPLRVEET